MPTVFYQPNAVNIDASLGRSSEYGRRMHATAGKCIRRTLILCTLQIPRLLRVYGAGWRLLLLGENTGILVSRLCSRTR